MAAPAAAAKGQAVWTRRPCYRCANNGCGNMAMGVDAARGQQDSLPCQATTADRMDPQSLLKSGRSAVRSRP